MPTVWEYDFARHRCGVKAKDIQKWIEGLFTETWFRPMDFLKEKLYLAENKIKKRCPIARAQNRHNKAWRLHRISKKFDPTKQDRSPVISTDCWLRSDRLAIRCQWDP